MERWRTGPTSPMAGPAWRTDSGEMTSLVNRILAPSEPLATEETEREWDLSIRDRIRRYEEGTARSRPAGDGFSDLDTRLAKRRSSSSRRQNRS